MASNIHDLRSVNHERRWQVLIDAVVDYAIYMLDVDGYVMSWNSGAERIKGYRQDEIIGQHYSRFFTAEDRAAGSPLRALSIARNAGRFETEGWRVRKDGTVFWALVVLDAIHDSDGNFLGFAKVTRDMTERRAALEALRASERSFRLLVDAVVDYAIFMLDKEGRVTSWNKGAERINGYSTAEIVGQHFSIFHTAEDRAAGLPAAALEVAARDGRLESEGWRMRKDGTRYFANVVVDPVRDETGEHIGYVKVTRDITERRLDQEDLKQARENLHQAQKLAALGHLTGGVAHDFNNVLTAIISNLALIRDGGTLTETATRQVEAGLQAAENGASIVQRMLVFARQKPLEPFTVDVNTVVQEIADLLRRTAGENVEIRTAFAADLRPARADPSQLQTSLLNLGLNACDAMASGGVVSIVTDNRRITNHAHLPPGEYVSIVVSDTGTGMTEDVLERAFEPFFTTKEIGKGTGLGLSTVYGMTRESGGDVTIATELGNGTSVELLLPVGETVPEATDAESPAEAPVANTGAAVTVLYVEDDFLVAMATLDTLEMSGFRVLSAARGEEALETLRQHPEIDLLLSDIGLPGMSGHEVVAEARRSRPDLKVVFITGYDREGPQAGTKPDAITKYVRKPYDPGALVRLVRELAAAPSLAGTGPMS